MFLENQPQKQIDYYEQLLRVVGSLSGLFSESSTPYLSPRVAENIFCKAFGAENHSRSDVSADASKSKLGFGIKTFLDYTGRSMQKIAEFNGDHGMFRGLDPQGKIEKIAQLRNERLATTKRILGLNDIIYHCVTRQIGRIMIYETPSPSINVAKIKDIKISASGNTIQFSDPMAEYSFSLSKSTLSRRFARGKILLEVPVRILKDPFAEIEKLMGAEKLIFASIKPQPHVFLPLYSVRKGLKEAPEKSGLNQWNASGRPRDPNEIYIPIPAWIHRKFPQFFPPRDKSFELTLPDRRILSAKVCQDQSKALMSNPNSDLGKWLLRDILNLKERELLAYGRLAAIGLDAVVIYKVDSRTYDIDFTQIGSYEEFQIENGEKPNSDLVPKEGDEE